MTSPIGGLFDAKRGLSASRQPVGRSTLGVALGTAKKNVTRQVMWSCLSLVFLIAFVALWDDSRSTLLTTENSEERDRDDGPQSLRPATVKTKEGRSSASRASLLLDEDDSSEETSHTNKLATSWNFTDIVLQKNLARPFPAKFNSQLRLLSGDNKNRTNANAKDYNNASEKDDSLWCTHDFDKHKATGLLYPKIPKTATSSIAGVAYRIAQNYGQHQRQSSNFEKGAGGCDVVAHHVQYYKVGKEFATRDYERSFLMSSIRDPAKRALSRVFFEQVSRKKGTPTDDNVLQWLNTTHSHRGSVSPGMGGFQLAYLSMAPIPPYSAWHYEESTTVQSPKAVEENVRRITEEYDFLVVVERLEESLVAWQLLMGLETSDMLYISSKRSGASYWLPDPNTHKGKVREKCIPLAKAVASEAVEHHLRSDEWYAKNYGDYLLHEAANQSLDMTINQVIGRDRFQQAVQGFQALHQRAHDICEPTAVFPCADDGTPQPQASSTNCYNGDQGCGYPCLDTL
jgi:hypothetical protein